MVNSLNQETGDASLVTALVWFYVSIIRFKIKKLSTIPGVESSVLNGQAETALWPCVLPEKLGRSLDQPS